MATAIIDFDSVTDPARSSTPVLARTVGFALLLGLGLALWGTLTTEAWRADDAGAADAVAAEIREGGR